MLFILILFLGVLYLINSKKDVIFKSIIIIGLFMGLSLSLYYYTNQFTEYYASKEETFSDYEIYGSGTFFDPEKISISFENKEKDKDIYAYNGNLSVKYGSKNKLITRYYKYPNYMKYLFFFKEYKTYTVELNYHT